VSRKWRDINELWLEKYLEDAGLEPLWSEDPEGAGIYEDHPFGWQVSWVLSDAEWTRLRRAWEHHVRHSTAAETAPLEDQGTDARLRDAFRCIERLTEQNRAMAIELEALRHRET